MEDIARITKAASQSQVTLKVVFKCQICLSRLSRVSCLSRLSRLSLLLYEEVGGYKIYKPLKNAGYMRKFGG